MKPVFFLVSAFLLFSSCKKEEFELLPEFQEFWSKFQGTASADLNGKPASRDGFQLRVRAGLAKYQSWDSAMAGLFFIRVNGQNVMREFFGIAPLELYRTGKFKIYQTTELTNADSTSKQLRSIMTLSGSDGDVHVGSYFVVPTEDNYVNITYFDKNEIRGEFRITYAKAQRFSGGDDTVRIRNAKFSAQITLGKELQ